MDSVLTGLAVSGGLAIGEACVFSPADIVVSEEYTDKTGSASELVRYNAAKAKVSARLTEIAAAMSVDADAESRIFLAHMDVLGDVTINNDIEAKILRDACTAEYAVTSVYGPHIDFFAKSPKEMLRERASDLRDVRLRLLSALTGREFAGLPRPGWPVVLVAVDLLPSDTATLDRKNVLAIVTEIGGATSHTAIIARQFGIPAVVGVDGITAAVRDGMNVIVDALNGKVFLQPQAVTLVAYSKKLREYTEFRENINKYISAKPVTLDGVHIDMMVNIGSDSDDELEMSEYSDGVGLFRTEFLYMSRAALPPEEEQFESYKRVAEAFGDRPVVIRTLDIGGDKSLDCLDLPKEENPFLGLRGLRLCFDRLPVFRTQLRAILRAASYGNISMMFPMVSCLDEIRGAKKIIAEVQAELNSQGLKHDPNIGIGIMVEIPSIALMADVVAAEVDFASIGTNDLCQYLTAADRLNPNVARYYRSYHPAMFRLIHRVASAFNKRGKPVSVCGEMAGEGLAVAALIGLGIRKFSMNRSSIAPVKKLITGLNTRKAERIAETLLNLSTAAQAEEFLTGEPE